MFADDIVAAIDIPIGLPVSGPRACDLAARKMLPGQGSRVFPAPCRAALAVSSYRECCDVNEAACGKRLSKQTFAIMPKIRAVDQVINRAQQRRIREAHPEVSFRLLGAARLEHSKKTPGGLAERLRILERNGLIFDLAQERLRLGRAKLANDDLLDAAICLVTAQRIVDGTAEVLGDGAFDGRGLRMEIVV